MTTPISRIIAPPPPTAVIATMVTTMAEIFRSHLPMRTAAVLPANTTLIFATKWTLALILYYHSMAAVTLYLLAPYLIDPLVATLSPYYEQAQAAQQAQIHQETIDHLQTAAEHCPSDDNALKALIKSAPTITAQFATTLLQKVPEEPRRETIGFALIANHEKSHAELLQAVIRQVPSLTRLIAQIYPFMTTHSQHHTFYALSPEACTQFMEQTLLLPCGEERFRRFSAIRSIHPQHPIFTNSTALLSFVTSQTGVPPDAIISLLMHISPTLKKNPTLFAELTRFLGPDVNDLYISDQSPL